MNFYVRSKDINIIIKYNSKMNNSINFTKKKFELIFNCLYQSIHGKWSYN